MCSALWHFSSINQQYADLWLQILFTKMNTLLSVFFSQLKLYTFEYKYFYLPRVKFSRPCMTIKRQNNEYCCLSALQCLALLLPLDSRKSHMFSLRLQSHVIGWRYRSPDQLNLVQRGERLRTRPAAPSSQDFALMHTYWYFYRLTFFKGSVPNTYVLKVFIRPFAGRDISAGPQ